MRNRIAYLAAFVFCSLSAFAAVPYKSFRNLDNQRTVRFEEIRERNFYLTGGNIAGMRCDSVSISTAMVSAAYTGGENRFLHEAPDAWNADVRAYTIMHLQKVSMYGAFSFRQDMGYGMCGSMMARPWFYPVNISEYTPGRKSRQTYSFNGGVSMDISQQWRLGLSLDYMASNYAKLKDLRYTDYSMDMTFRAGAQYVASNGLSVGVAAAFLRNTETLAAEQVGESNTSYYAFLDKGAFFGTRQVWTGGGLHLSEAGISGFPLAEIGAGLSAQLSFGGLYAELAYSRKSGHAGEKDAIWFTFPTNTFLASLSYRWNSRHGVTHTFRADASYDSRILNESVIDRVTQGGVTIRHNYGSNVVQRSGDFVSACSWKAVREGLFIARLGVNYENDRMTATIQYPGVTFHRLQKLGADASLIWFFPRGWSVDASLRAGGGWYREDNWTASGAVESASVLYRSDSEYENWKFQNTNPYFCVKFAPRYTFPLNIYLSAYAGCEWRPTTLTARQYRVSTGLTLGYTF